MAVVANRIYVADGEAGLRVLSTLPNVQFAVRVDAMPFDYVVFDVKLSNKPHKFYRVRQP